MRKATIDLTFLRTAAVGPIGLGTAGGAVKRCMECPWAKLGWGACGGFGEGCLVSEEPNPRPACS